MANPYDISIPDSSPTIIYHPFRESEDVASGWKSFYTGSPDDVYDHTFNNTNRGSGTSLHSTSMQGASFEFGFAGTAISIYGSGSKGGYTTKLDDGNDLIGAPEDGILASYVNLEYKVHKIVLEVTQSQSLNLTSVLATVGVGRTGAIVKQRQIDAVNVNPDGTSSLNSNFFSTVGPGFNTRGNNDALAYPRVDTNTAGSSIILRFSSASAIMVRGAVYHDHGTFNAVLNPSAGVSNSPRVFNATSKWFASDTLIYWESGLDRTQSYNLSLTNGDQNKYLDVSSVVVLDGKGGTDETTTNLNPSSLTIDNSFPKATLNSSSTDHSLNRSSGQLSTGAIAGISVGGAAAAAILIALLVFSCRRRKPPSQDRTVKQVSRSNIHFIQPFVYQPEKPSPTTPNCPYSHSHSLSDSSNYPRGIGGARESSSSMGPSRHPQHPWIDSSPSSSGCWTVSGSSQPSRSTQRTRMSTPTVRQETDAGPLPHPQEDEIVLPPGYNSAWESGRDVSL